MRKITSLLLASLVILLLSSATSFAAAVGVSVDLSQGSGEAEWDSDIYEWDIDGNAYGVGFVMDTAPLDESTFNYRLNVGVARQELEDEFDVDMESNGIYVENTFGFALSKSANHRFWLGPLVRVGFYSGDSDTVRVSATTISETELDYAEFALGVAAGLNFRAGAAIVSPSVGVRFTGFAGEGETTERDDLLGTTRYEEDIEGSFTSVFFNLAVLF